VVTIFFTELALIVVDFVTAAAALSFGTFVMVNSEAALAPVARNLPSAAKRRFEVHNVFVVQGVFASRPNVFFTSVQTAALNCVEAANLLQSAIEANSNFSLPVTVCVAVVAPVELVDVVFPDVELLPVVVPLPVVPPDDVVPPVLLPVVLDEELDDVELDEELADEELDVLVLLV